ncbi:MAG TPA: hypothetical protein VMH02_08250 [Verrucomicrobiae bacterium]|nr:hypothetical protein [Verrucomicrobiae bacterium]
MKPVALAAALLLAACTTGQSDTTPPISSGGGGTSSSVLQLSMGTVNFAGMDAGLDVLETFRDANGYTALPITSAALAGPPGFHGVRGSKDPGAGASGRIPLGSASNAFLVGAGLPTTEIDGVDGFGIGPPGCSCPGVNAYPMQPQFADTANFGSVYPGGAEPFYGGPPAYPPTTLEPSSQSSLVSIPSSWPEGFYLIGVDHPPGGRYTILAQYQQNGTAHTATASASLDAARRLPVISVTATANRKGFVYVSLQLPHGVTQALVNLIDANVPPAPGATCATGLGFATMLFRTSGIARLRNDLGNDGAGGARTFCPGDEVLLQAYGFDYDDFALGPPGNEQQSPPLPAHADVTVSLPTLIVMPGSPSRQTARFPTFR